MMELYNKVCQECSKYIINCYSIFFFMGICVFDKWFWLFIYVVYGFVCFVDEIVDIFYDYFKKVFFDCFWEDIYWAIDECISFNLVLYVFQEIVYQYQIECELIDVFLDSMEMDLYFDCYYDSLYKKYIYGFVEVVGLMCLWVFVEGDDE